MFHTAQNEKITDLERIIDEYQDQLFSFAFFRVGSFDVAQDIVQESFLHLYRKNHKLSEVSNLKGYLLKAISNRCIDYRRRNKIHLSVDLLSNVADDCEQKVFVEEFIEIETILSGIPPEQAEIVRLHFVDL